MSSLKSFTLIVGITSAFAAVAGPVAVAIAATIVPASPASHVVAPQARPTLVLGNVLPRQQRSGPCFNQQLPSPVVHLNPTETRAPLVATRAIDVASVVSVSPHSGSQSNEASARPCCPGIPNSSSQPRSPGVAAPTRTGQPRARAVGQPARRARWCSKGLGGSTAGPGQFARQV